MKTKLHTKQFDWELIRFGSLRNLQSSVKMLLLLVFLSVGFEAFSQDNDDDQDSSKREKVEQLKIAYITKELNLTSEEAQKFWPIYNEMDSKLKANRKEQRKVVKELREKRDVLKEDELKKKINTLLDCETKEVAIKREYIEKIAGVIGYKKSAKLINLEQDFKRELLKRLNEGKNMGPNSQKGQGQKQIKRE